MHELRSGLAFHLLAHVGPEIMEEYHVGLQLFFRFAIAGSANDKAAGDAGTMRLQNFLQAQALFIGGNLARDTDVIDRRHVHEEAAGQGDMRGDAGAFLAERLLGNLNNDFLAFTQQIRDGGHGRPGPLFASFTRLAGLTCLARLTGGALLARFPGRTLLAGLAHFGLGFTRLGFSSKRLRGWPLLAGSTTHFPAHAP